MKRPYRDELAAILRLAGPLIAAQLAYVAMVFTDTVMMGKLGREALAAGGLGASTYALISTFCVGVVAATGNLVAIRHGAKDARGVVEATQPACGSAPRWRCWRACCCGTSGRS